MDEDTYVGSVSDYDPSRHGLGGILTGILKQPE